MNITGRQLVAVDLRNHGESPHANSHKYEELTMDVINLFEKLKINRATIIGHGMGGRTAMCVSLIAAKRVTGLIIIDTSPVSTPKQLNEEFPKILIAMKSVDFKNAKKVNNAKTEAKKQLENIVTDDLTMDTVLSNVKVKPDGTIGWACNVEIFIKHFPYIKSFPPAMTVKQYYGPTLFIGGQMSEFLP
ncbi:protein ABHD11-like [Manduca sexta]|uniref:protein ABHD11-like n=1 Tax=Manduca sexta TaxID=7130 RepID=UPI00188F981A|nr:protein ABHD11-like [Manduca sexta]